MKKIRKLVEADKDGRCVVFTPRHAIVKNYNPKDEDGLYTMTVCGVISEEEYKSVIRG